MPGLWRLRAGEARRKGGKRESLTIKRRAGQTGPMLEPRRKEADVPLPSLKSFGLTFAAVFALIGLIHVPFEGLAAARIWALAVAGAFLVTTFTFPKLLAPLNRLWFRFGMLLHKVVNPVVMGVIYFGILVPMAVTMKIFGKRFLKLSREPQAPSYWIERAPPGPEPASIRQQF